MEIINRIRVPFWWLFVSGFIFFLSLAIIIFYNVKKDVPWKINIPISILFIIISVLLFSIGPITETIAWFIINKGFSALSYLSIINQIILLNVPNNFADMLFSASITAATISVCNKQIKDKLLIGSISAILSLSVTDIILQLKHIVLGNLLFSLLSNIFGGLILAGILTYIYVFLSIAFKLNIEFKAIFINHLKYISFAITGTFIISLLAYFLFIYQIPSNIYLHLKNWGTVTFYYHSDKNPLSKDLYITIPFKTTEFFSVLSRDALDINWEFTSSKKKNKEKSNTTNIGVFSIVDGKTKPIYKGKIPEGNIKIIGKKLKIVMNINDGKMGYNFLAMLKDKSRIWFIKDIEEMLYYRNLLRGRQNQKKIIELLSEGEGIKTTLGSKSILIRFVPNWLFGFYKKNENDIDEHIKIKLPLKPEKEINVEKRGDVYIVIANKTDQMTFYIKTLLNFVEMKDADYRFEGFSIGRADTKVGEFYVRSPKGTINIRREKLSLDIDNLLYIGGDDLKIKDNPFGELILEGSSNQIAIDGVPYSLSLWSGISKTSQNGIIAGVFTIIGIFIGWLLNVKIRNRIG